jgi:hypothetical protein
VTRIPDEKADHNNKHKSSVERVCRPLISEKIAIGAHGVFDHAKYIPDLDQQRGRVKHT